MDRKRRLLDRLDDIGGSLERSGHALALIGLGSVGLELDRVDEYSDLDFFVIVEPGHKGAYLENLDWLSAVCPIAYHFRNTPFGDRCRECVGFLKSVLTDTELCPAEKAKDASDDR